jgi:prefoldin subunit 5
MMEAEQCLDQAQIDSVQVEIQNVGTYIAELAITIRDLEETVGATKAMGNELELAALFQKIGSLRDEKNKLHDEKNKLRDEKKYILLSKQGVCNYPIGSSNFTRYNIVNIIKYFINFLLILAH